MDDEIIHGLDSYLTFRLGSEYIGVNIGNVTKILGLVSVTRVPNSPRYFTGIINHFGEVLPVFDGRLKFGFQEVENTRHTCILILVFELDGQVLSSGIVFDSVEKVVVLDRDHIKSPPSVGKSFDNKFIYGISNVNDEFLIILNLEKIFSEEEISIINTVD